MSELTENGLSSLHTQSEVIEGYTKKRAQVSGEDLLDYTQQNLKNHHSLNGLDPGIRDISQLSGIDLDTRDCSCLREKNSLAEMSDNCGTDSSAKRNSAVELEDAVNTTSSECVCSVARGPSHDAYAEKVKMESLEDPAAVLDSSTCQENCEVNSTPAAEESGDGVVLMRKNRGSQQRKERTDTAVISNIFHFLQNDEVATKELKELGVVRECDCDNNSVDTDLPADESAGEPCDERELVSAGDLFDNVDQAPKLECENAGGDSAKCGAGEEEALGTASGSGAGELAAEAADGKAEARTPADSAPEVEVRMRRSRLCKQESTEETVTDDSSDEDVGVYAESFRRSNWIRLDDDGKLELSLDPAGQSRLSSASQSSAIMSDATDSPDTPDQRTDEVFPDSCPSPRLFKYHKRSESTSTTLSEKEFKKEYITRRKCLIQRQNSSKEYHRFSARVYDEEKTVVLEKGTGDSDYGLHILDSQPAFITQVDPGSAAERAGVQEGQILVSINGTSVLTSSHDDIVRLMAASAGQVRLEVAMSDFQPSRDLQASVMEGYMQKLSEGIVRMWKKRYFILRQDSCLYYYKQKDDADPLGAIPLAGYTFSRHLDHGRDYSFKAEKYGAKTYFFVTESRDEMTGWVGALGEAAARSKKRKESFVSVSSHNVSLPALEVRRPECTGYLLKVGNRHRTWRRRYCVLKDACLYYFKNMNSLSALGVAHLHGYKVDPWMTVGKKHAFGLVPPDPTLRTFQFSAENDTDRQRWVDAMIRSIQRWIQIDNDC